MKRIVVWVMSVLLSLTCLNISPPPAIAQPINCPEATVEGLQAEYFNNSHLTEPVLQRIDKTINFDWESGSPDSSIAPDTFSERWTGFITPKYSETYTFTTRSDDGVRLWINDQMIIDQWNYHPATNHSGSIELTAGQQYSIRIEHYEYGGMAVAQLYWSSPSQAQEIVPASQLSPNKIPESCNVEPGSISGVKWKDINGDGDRDKKLLQGDKPDVVFVIDVSQSAVQSDFAGSPVGDVNGSGNPNRILDAELAGFIALNEQLINQGLQDNARIGIVIFGAYGKTVDMDPSSPELQLVTTPGTDNNGNGTPDVEDILRSIKANNVTPYNLEVNGEKVPDASPGTNYEDALQSTLKLLQSVDSEAGNANVIFISDGEPYPSPQEFTDEVAQLKALPAKVQAFGAGEGAELPPLQILNRNAQIFTTTDDLLGVFSGLQPPSKVAAEPPLAGVTIYLDLNNNGQLDTDEPSQVTDSKGTFTFTDLAPGTYIVREVEPDGFTITAPKKGFATVTVEAGQGLTGVDFGNMKNSATISGLKCNDLNSDGKCGEKLLQGDKPDVVFVIDVSQSTVKSDFAGSPVGDVNGNGNPNRILDAELAGFIALNEQLINQGLQDNARIGILIFGAYGKTVDMDPSSSGLQLVTTPGTDNNGNGTPDVEDILRSIKANNVTPYNLEVNGEKVPDASPGTNYEDALQSALKLLQSVDSEAGNANVIFISDGEPYPSPQEFSDEVAQLKALPAKLQAFGAGERAELPPLQILNPNAQIFTTTDDLLGVFSGLQPPSKVAAEPPLAGVTIYLDLNNNGQLDTDEPSQVTNSKGTFTFTDLVPGTYIVREVEPDGFTITAPEKGFATVTVEAGQGLTGVDFGNVESPATGSIAGLKWDDLNGNGGRDSQILKGFPPNAVFVVDLSGSTIINNFKGTPVGDVNNTGQANTVLDAELAGFTALNDQLINIGAGNESKVGIVVFAERGLQVDMDPATPGLQVYTTPLADNNRNGIPDVQEVLAQIQAFNPNYVYGQGTYQVKIGGQSMDIGAGTNFEPPLQLARSTAGAIGTEDINIIFLSDGNPGGGTQGTTYQYYQTNFLDEAQSIQASGFNVVAFGVGEGASLEALRKIDPEAQIFTTTDEIIDVFSGTGSGESGSISRGELEPVLPGVTVYVDLNNNGILDDGEPSQVTDDNGQYQFSDLKPGTYVVREIVPAGYRQTFPGDAHRVELGADQQVSGLNFGNVK